MKKIYFKGYYGYKNLGDDVFTITSKYLATVYGEDIETYYVGQNLPKIDVLNSKSITKGSNIVLNLKELIMMFKVDRVIYFGGSLFENAGKSPLNVKYLISKFNVFKGKLYAFGVSVGPFKDENTKQDVSKLLNRFTKVFVRDNDSVNQMSEMNFSNKSNFVFDPAILIRSMYPQLIRKGRVNDVDDDTIPKIIGISLCRYESFKNGNIELERSRELTLLKTVEMLIENNKVPNCNSNLSIFSK